MGWPLTLRRFLSNYFDLLFTSLILGDAIFLNNILLFTGRRRCCGRIKYGIFLRHTVYIQLMQTALMEFAFSQCSCLPINWNIIYLRTKVEPLHGLSAAAELLVSLTFKLKLEKLCNPKGSRIMPPPGLQIYLGHCVTLNFDLITHTVNSCPCPVYRYHLCQLAWNRFIYFQNIMFTSLVMDELRTWEHNAGSVCRSGLAECTIMTCFLLVIENCGMIRTAAHD